MKTLKKCKTCKHFFDTKVKGARYANWCCQYSKPIQSAIGHCNIKNGYDKLASSI